MPGRLAAPRRSPENYRFLSLSLAYTVARFSSPEKFMHQECFPCVFPNSDVPHSTRTSVQEAEDHSKETDTRIERTLITSTCAGGIFSKNLWKQVLLFRLPFICVRVARSTSYLTGPSFSFPLTGTFFNFFTFLLLALCVPPFAEELWDQQRSPNANG